MRPPILKCFNCKRVIVKKYSKGHSASWRMPKTCPWCKQHVPSRQSKRSHREKKK